MIRHLRVKTNARTELVDITQGIQRLVTESGVRSGVCYIYVPHTTAGITINENTDPNAHHRLVCHSDTHPHRLWRRRHVTHT